MKELQLNSPITDEQWDAITDVDFDHTDRITFHTKHGKEVEFVKSKPIKTNADKYFRNATDKEIAQFIAKAQADILRTVGRALKYPGDLARDCGLEDAADHWLYWLKQEVESDE